MKKVIDAINNIAVVCLVFKLKNLLTPNFWVNVFDPSMNIPGFARILRLRPTTDTIVYIPYYMPATKSGLAAQRRGIHQRGVRISQAGELSSDRRRLDRCEGWSPSLCATYLPAGLRGHDS